jgi:hypothetical protein
MYRNSSMSKKPKLVKEVYAYILGPFGEFWIGTNMESHKVLADNWGIENHRDMPHGVITVDHVHKTTQATFYTWSNALFDSDHQEKAHNAVRERYGYTDYKKI